MAGSDVGRNENCSHLSDRPIERGGLGPLPLAIIACGAPSGVVVIDIDLPAEVTELFNLATLCASTPSGGRHLYCRYVEGIRNRVFDWGEVRSTGLYVVGPPATGREWLNNSVIADVPENLAKIVPEAPTVTSSVPSGSWADAIADHRKTVARWSREESFALVAYRNATSRVLNAKHRMIALNAETYANLLETGNGRPGADRPYKGGHHGRHQI